MEEKKKIAETQDDLLRRIKKIEREEERYKEYIDLLMKKEEEYEAQMKKEYQKLDNMWECCCKQDGNLRSLIDKKRRVLNVMGKRRAEFIKYLSGERLKNVRKAEQGLEEIYYEMQVEQDLQKKTTWK